MQGYRGRNFAATEKQAAKYLGKAVEMARVERGMKRTELEEKTQLSYAYLSEIEKGRKYPSQSAIARLAEALDLTSFELLSRAEDARTGQRHPRSVRCHRRVDRVHCRCAAVILPACQDTAVIGALPTERSGDRWASSVRSGGGEDLVGRVSAEVYRTVEPRMREWLMREIQLAVREELLRQREAR